MSGAIAADEGSSTAAMATASGAQPTLATGTYQTAGYGHHSYISASTPAEYDQQLYVATGAGPTTMYWMAGTVMLAYVLLFMIMCTSCFMPPRVYGFARVRDVESQPKVPLSGPVAELDKQWRNSFVAKVYSILSVQLALTVAICFSMMQ